MGVQIPRGLHSEIPPQGLVRGAPEGPRNGLPRTSPSKGMSYRGGPSAARSCPYAIEYSAQACSGCQRGVSQGQECDAPCPHVSRPQSQFPGRELLGARGYVVSTVGRDEAKSREYIRNQEQE